MSKIAQLLRAVSSSSLFCSTMDHIRLPERANALHQANHSRHVCHGGAWWLSPPSAAPCSQLNIHRYHKLLDNTAPPPLPRGQLRNPSPLFRVSFEDDAYVNSNRGSLSHAAVPASCISPRPSSRGPRSYLRALFLQVSRFLDLCRGGYGGLQIRRYRRSDIRV